MRERKYQFLTALLCLFIFYNTSAQSEFSKEIDFEKKETKFKKIGRGECMIKNGVLKTRNSYVTFGNVSWKNYQISFKARTPEDEEQVQIWAGFRAQSRDDRYVLGIRGGLKNDLYLARIGYMGADEFLGLRQLDFTLVPGKWYEVRVIVCENRIRVFIDDDNLPVIDVIDKNSSLVPSGRVTLGGGWIQTEYDDLTITSIPDDFLDGVRQQEKNTIVTLKEKEIKRKAERASYKPIVVDRISDTRTEISLNGRWLFMPKYQMNDENKAVSPDTGDQDWHVMTVPNFWNPIRIWLHGETFDGHAKGASDRYFQMETERCERYTFDYKKTKVAWYRQWIELPENVKGKDVELAFDAVSKVAEVWVNGVKAGGHIGMFGDFNIEADHLFKPGMNLVVVKVVRDFVKNIEEADKVVDVAVTVPVTNRMLKDLAHGFYNGNPAGIWQPVKLVITNPLKITDVYINPSLEGGSFEVTVKNNSKGEKNFALSMLITGKGSFHELYEGLPLKSISLVPEEEKKLTFTLEGLQPELWSPASPNLYDFTFRLLEKTTSVDEITVVSGFRTFESRDGFLYLNGKRYWLRGGNQTPFALAPNNVELADTFYQLMNTGNIEITRTHTTPYNELWMDAADRNGIGVSFEGTWPWLMIHESMPEEELIELWADEFLDLVRKYRNHPSLLFWTVNNEMKFYDNDPDFERVKKKMAIISDVVKRMRKVDPSRPISFDSNYRRKEDKFGKSFFDEIDDGDIDDIHAYTNWYNHSVFQQFKGEFQQRNKNEGRPLISQEMSTGYPNTETGHPTRFYTIVHQNPSSLVGDLGYEFSDPSYFLKVHSFITGELAEALRRSNDQASGILHFALLTWFRNVYDPDNIEPYPTYYAIKRALQPVLVSAELWGRHFYNGERIFTRICIVNDSETGDDLPATLLKWELVDENGHSLASGESPVKPVEYYEREWIQPEILVPAKLNSPKIKGNLKLKLFRDEEVISANEYELTLASKEWCRLSRNNQKSIVLVDFNNTKKVLDHLGVQYLSAASVSEALETKADLYVLAGLHYGENCSEEEIQQIKTLVDKGERLLVLNSGKTVENIFPEYITGGISPTEGDIVNMEMPESEIFDGIDQLELRYFNNNRDEMPTVCNWVMKVAKDPKVVRLASQMKIHGYINGRMEERVRYVESIKGFPIIEIRDKGKALISTMSLEKGISDPIAGKLMANMIQYLLN